MLDRIDPTIQNVSLWSDFNGQCKRRTLGPSGEPVKASKTAASKC